MLQGIMISKETSKLLYFEPEGQANFIQTS